MPSMFGICPRRRTGIMSWLFGNSKVHVAVGFDEDPQHALAGSSGNTIVKARIPYNLRPRRKAISYKEPEEDPEA